MSIEFRESGHTEPGPEQYLAQYRQRVAEFRVQVSFWLGDREAGRMDFSMLTKVQDTLVTQGKGLYADICRDLVNPPRDLNDLTQLEQMQEVVRQGLVKLHADPEE